MTIYLRRSEKTGKYYFAYHSEGEMKLLDLQKIDAYTFWLCGGVTVRDVANNNEYVAENKNVLFEILKGYHS